MPISILMFGFLTLTSSQNASAYSATLTTGTDIKLNASPSGDGTSIHEESINVVSDCRAGYNLSIATPEGSNLYADGNTSNPATFTAVDGTSALNSTNNTNKWGYTLTTNPTSSTVFLPLSSTQSVLKTSSQTANPNANINDTFNINYGVKVDNTIVPGSYKMANSGSIVYYLTMAESCNVVDIAYDGNNADAGTMGAVGTGVIHTGVKDGDTVSLIASNFSRSGYGFAGWSLDPNAGPKLVDNDNTNNPVVYGPQEEVTLPDGFIANDTDNDNIVKLYAVWIQSQGNLQGWIGCSNLDTATYDSTTGKLDLTKNSVTALTDQRDNDTYAVARLADGQCWMIENLRLENTNSDNTTGALAQDYGTSTTYGNFGGLAGAESTNFSNSTTANSLYYSGAQSGDATIDIGTTSYPGYRMPRYNNLNTTNRATNPTSNIFPNNTTGGMYSYGNYYTWHAAIADLTYNDDTNHQSTTGTSLCPTGWHLPTGGMAYASGSTSGVNVTGDTSTFREFYNLGYKTMDEVKTAYEDTPSSGYAYYSSNTTNTAGKTATTVFRSFPNNFLYSGNFGTSSASNRGSRGSYWSSTAVNSNNSYNLYLDSSNVSPGTGTNLKYYGLSIRCIASAPVTYTLTYDANGGSDAPNSQTIIANGATTFTIASTAPARSGYTFVSWVDEKGNEYQPGDSFTTRDVDTALYAIWTNDSCNPNATTIGTGNTSTDAVCLQDVTPNMKTSLPTADATTGTYTLIDARDGQSYTVAKLADGNLWLTSDLRLGSTEKTTMLTSRDTDTSNTFLLPMTETNETKTQWGTLNSTEGLDVAHAYKYNNTKTLYNWYTATAGTFYTNLNATTSICPSNWKLVTKAQAEAYLSAVGEAPNSTNTTILTDLPLSFNNGYYNSTTQTAYTNKVYWTANGWQNSSTKYYYGYYFGIGTSSNVDYIRTTYGYQKMMGLGIRCIASNGTVTINYDGNGTNEYPVTGSVTSQIDIDISPTAYTQADGFTRTGWVFNGWNTAADGSGTAIAANTAIINLNPIPGSTITLYAQWLPQRQIIYNDNCSYNNVGCATSTDTTNTSSWTNAGSNITLGSDTYFTTKSGYIITSWNTARDGSGTSYNISSSYTVPSTLTAPDQVTLYAQWLPQYTITYVNNCQTYASVNTSCTTTVSNGTSEQKINLTNNPSTGTETGTLGAYNKFTLTGWKIKEWTTSADGTGTTYPVASTYTVPVGSSAGSGITLYAHWIPVYSIQYDGNNADNPNGMGTTNTTTGVKSVKQTNVGEGDPVTLLASNFKKPGYGFAGWSTDPDAYTHFTDNDNTNDSIIYGPMETIDAPAYPTNGTNIITMYAVWVPAEKSDPSDPSSSPLYLQDFTASDCNALTSADFNTTTGVITPGSVIALTDKRDDEVYTIAKLADDNCWMIENLRLEHEGTVGNNKNDTSVTNQSLSQGYGGTPGTYGSFVGLANPESANFYYSSTTANSIYKSSAASPTDTYNPSTSTLEDIGSSNFPAYRFPRYNNNSTQSLIDSTTYTQNYANASSPSDTGNYRTLSNIYGYGNYYNWAAAMANTNFYTSLSTSEAANTSICPSNWHLPSSSTATKEYGILSQRYGGTGSNQSGTGTGDIMSNRFRSFPNNFLYSGYFKDSYASSRGTHGRYWSRSVYSYGIPYNLGLNSTDLYPSGGIDSAYGFSVRCLIGS